MNMSYVSGKNELTVLTILNYFLIFTLDAPDTEKEM